MMEQHQMMEQQTKEQQMMELDMMERHRMMEEHHMMEQHRMMEEHRTMEQLEMMELEKLELLEMLELDKLELDMLELDMLVQLEMMELDMLELDMLAQLEKPELLNKLEEVAQEHQQLFQNRMHFVIDLVEVLLVEHYNRMEQQDLEVVLDNVHNLVDWPLVAYQSHFLIDNNYLRHYNLVRNQHRTLRCRQLAHWHHSYFRIDVMFPVVDNLVHVVEHELLFVRLAVVPMVRQRFVLEHEAAVSSVLR